MDVRIEEVVGSLPLEDMEGIVLQIPGVDGEKSLSEAVRHFASGKSASPEEMLASILNGFADEIAKLGELMISVMLPALFLGLVTQMTTVQDRLELAGINLCHVIAMTPVVVCVIGELEHVKSTIIVTTERMDRILPILLTLLTAVGGSASSAFLHPVVVAASGSMVYLAREVILRLVMCSCAVVTVNHLSDRAHLTRMARLLKGAVCWLLGVSFTVFLGTMSIQGVVSASVDGVTIRAAKYAVDNFVPVVGGMFSDTMDTLVGCTLIVKNALGIAAMLVLGGAIVVPMIRTFAAAAVMKVCAALLEPVADRNLIGAIEDMSGILVLFLITMLCVCTMYFLLIVQILLVGNLTMMLR